MGILLNRSKRVFRRRPEAAADDRIFVELCYRAILRRDCDESGLRHYLQELQRGMTRQRLIEELFTSPEYENRFAACRAFPPGDLLSPLPSGDDIRAHASFDWNPAGIPGIELNTAGQWDLLQRLARHYPKLKFPAQPVPGHRYYYENSSYSYADAIFLGCMILEFHPKQIIEVGSGFSSAAILDINDAFFGGRIACTFIDPDPGRLHSLLKPEDDSNRLIPKRMQEVPLDLFSQLETSDILFIDSSHVSKLNSDANRFLFEILPRLQRGVLIHFHDVFYPFEYPLYWLERGWVWNEQYLLHAFLQYNEAFAIRIFSTWLFQQDRSWFERNLPDCLKNPGGCLWLEKRM